MLRVELAAGCGENWVPTHRRRAGNVIFVFTSAMERSDGSLYLISLVPEDKLAMLQSQFFPVFLSDLTWLVS